MRTIALDLGKRKIVLCEMKDGEVIARRTVRSRGALKRDLGPAADPARVVFEACREAWTTHDLLTSWGNEVIVADTTRVRQLGIGQHGRKTDRIDAETLAVALEQGRLPCAHVLSEHRRKLRELLCVRRALVGTRSRYVTELRGLLSARGIVMPRCATKDFAARLLDSELPEETARLAAPLADLLPSLAVQISEVESRLHDLCGEEPVVQKLATVPGVSMLVAAAYVSVIDDANRFRRAAHVASYVGLVPSENSSADKRRLGRITKKGNSYLRMLLVQSAWCILRLKADDPLAVWGRQIAQRRGRNIAAVAVARRLVRLLWALWRDDAAYDPHRLALRSARGVERLAEQTHDRARSLRQAKQKLDRQRRASDRVGDRARKLLEEVTST